MQTVMSHNISTNSATQQFSRSCRINNSLFSSLTTVATSRAVWYRFFLLRFCFNIEKSSDSVQNEFVSVQFEKKLSGSHIIVIYASFSFCNSGRHDFDVTHTDNK